jgi:hypothetical protein
MDTITVGPQDRARKRQMAGQIERDFPGVLAWYGVYTGAWWAAVQVGDRLRLVEAITPAELREAIANARGWPWPC